jgi:hypothetical protein
MIFHLRYVQVHSFLIYGELIFFQILHLIYLHTPKMIIAVFFLLIYNILKDYAKFHYD